MVEFQLEKLSPIPVTQIVWTFHILPQAAAENLQTVVVVIAERGAVEEFLGKLEVQGYLADRLEVPLLDQLEARPANEDSAWVYPATLNGQNAALVAWWFGGALRNLSFVVLPPAGDRAKSLKDQFAQLTWAGEMEGWLTAQPQMASRRRRRGGGRLGNFFARKSWASRCKWRNRCRPRNWPRARRGARRRRIRAAVLLPAEFSARYQQQFVDRLWLRGLFATGIFYPVCVAIYFCATFLLGIQTRQSRAAGRGHQQ